ncbi:hypothetical protein BUALT_Bualt10G0091600 [Buddleja alternifolia]|uniref:FAS1 domain-containing protein n=1 Tax=Buddleja alternifolia TaxID=168488 RepID=A0AAV6WWG7_9LAMI|nr:hypothetical protein BUALT_Bualt10G0091600 [Buddleja alternifolia]
MSTSRVIISAVLLLSSIATTSAFNITRILEKYPEFTQFNTLLTNTKVADQVNSRKSITVLALNNDRVGEIAGKQEDALKRILSTHIILDYFDVLKLNKLKDTKTLLTTLYQASGTADDQQGFLNVVHQTGGSIVFGSAMKGAPVDAKLEASVLSQPYNVSVLSISKPILAPGIDGALRPASAPPPKAVTAPTPSTTASPPPAASPESDMIADAPAPATESPTSTPPSEAPAPADATPADVTPPPSAAVKQVVSGVSLGLVVALASFL